MEFPQFRAHLGANKKILHKIHHHICAAFGGCLKRFFPVPLRGQRLGHTSTWSNSLRKILPAMWRCQAWMGCVLCLYRQMAAVLKETLAGKRLATTLFFVDLFGFAGLSQGRMQVTVFGRWGGPKNIIKVLHHGIQLQPNTQKIIGTSVLVTWLWRKINIAEGPFEKHVFYRHFRRGTSKTSEEKPEREHRMLRVALQFPRFFVWKVLCCEMAQRSPDIIGTLT